MRDSTTIRVAREAADGLRDLARDDGKSIGNEVATIVRAERQRRLGQALAQQEPDDNDRAWLDLAGDTAGERARG